jgi:SAM-dependent methyltransferase
MKFDEAYWQHNYAEPETMDGIGNAKEHLRYIQAVFALEQIDIASIIDLGCGHGVLFKKLLKTYLPYQAMAIEPSEVMFSKLKIDKLKPVDSTKLTLYQEDLLTWCKRKTSRNLRFDLAICMSVFQYIAQEQLQQIIPILAQRVKFLYLTVPTDHELKKQRENLQFHDHYAIERSQKFYLDLLKPHFRFVSNRLLESKFYFNDETTLFSDMLFRF